jgi:hypothetical protein
MRLCLPGSFRTADQQALPFFIEGYPVWTTIRFCSCASIQRTACDLENDMSIDNDRSWKQVITISIAASETARCSQEQITGQFTIAVNDFCAGISLPLPEFILNQVTASIIDAVWEFSSNKGEPSDTALTEKTVQLEIHLPDQVNDLELFPSNQWGFFIVQRRSSQQHRRLFLDLYLYQE